LKAAILLGIAQGKVTNVFRVPSLGVILREVAESKIHLALDNAASRRMTMPHLMQNDAVNLPVTPYNGVSAKTSLGDKMSRIISTSLAPAAIGPYVQGVDLGNMIITSGQIPVDPQTGAVADDITAQTRQSLENVKAIIEAAGLKVADIVKTTVFVKDLNDFTTVNAAYEAFFTAHQASFPARSCVEVARLPKDVKIEIEAIAIRR
jgi:2-iminobutanoate/2-iminopropanoate deaminase